MEEEEDGYCILIWQFCHCAFGAMSGSQAWLVHDTMRIKLAWAYCPLDKCYIPHSQFCCLDTVLGMLSADCGCSAYPVFILGSVVLFVLWLKRALLVCMWSQAEFFQTQSQEDQREAPAWCRGLCIYKSEQGTHLIWWNFLLIFQLVWSGLVYW